MIQLLHTPEGVRDYYNEENARKLALCQKIRNVFTLYGFQEIQTPVFEYFDIFNAERGSIASRDMYKLFDRDGETLVLRPDFTPSIARCAAKYFGGDTLPVRLSYLGNTYVNNTSLRGLLKETTQAGVELVGDDSVAANAEIIALVIDVLKRAGLKRFQIEIGDVRFFRGLLDAAGISDEVRGELRTCIENKNHFGLEMLLDKHAISEELAKILIRLPQMFGDARAVLEEAKALANNEVSMEAVNRLEELYHRMEIYGVSEYITFDLGMLGAHDYYTGMIFKGYTYGTGECIVNGGRYDNLLEQFGKKAASVGFGIGVDILLQAMVRQKIPMKGRPEGILVLYVPERFRDAVSLASDYRAQNIPVTLVAEDGRALDSYIDFTRENHITRVLRVLADGSVPEYIPASRLNKILPCPENE